MTNFTSKQKEIVARKLGYDGPMQGFDEFVASTPALQAKFNMVTQKYVERMAKGGVVKKYADGGTVTYGTVTNPTQAADVKAGAPNIADVAKINAATVSDQEAAKAQATVEKAAGTVEQAGTAKADATGVTAPAAISADQYKASTSTEGVQNLMSKTEAVQGTVSQQAQVDAATREPTTTAVGDVQAEQGTAAQVTGVTPMEVKQDELVSGTAVDQGKVEQALAQNVAAEGQVTEEMTVQGQMNKLMSDFDAGKPPPWAAGAMRAATAQMAARGIGASSMAGQAIIQSAIESATPLAAADAATFKEMGLQNLSNRQAMALATAQQRATFLGQEFDQNFQTKVLNAARIADVANKNFDATVQIQLENARLANTMNLQNLSNKQALVMEKAAQIANLEKINLTNEQQARIANAEAFLQMDVANLNNEQQTSIFKAQAISDSMMADAAQQNAAKATNAKNALDAASTNATLALSASQYNAVERNKVAVANMQAETEILKFNAQEQNDRAEFNAEQVNAINLSNAKILADISMSNTKEINAANAVNAKNATDLSASMYAQLSQTYRDKLEMSFKAGESDADRSLELAKASLQSYTQIATANKTADAQSSASIGKFVTDIGLKIIDKDPFGWFD